MSSFSSPKKFSHYLICSNSVPYWVYHRLHSVDLGKFGNFARQFFSQFFLSILPSLFLRYFHFQFFGFLFVLSFFVIFFVCRFLLICFFVSQFFSFISKFAPFQRQFCIQPGIFLWIFDLISLFQFFACFFNPILSLFFAFFWLFHLASFYAGFFIFVFCQLFLVEIKLSFF